MSPPAMFASRATSALAGFVLMAFATGHANTRDAGPVFTDSSRLVALGGSITEIVYALGEEKRLIARDSTSLYPPAAMTLSDVGYMRALSPEGVLSVEPSAILALEGSGPAEAVEVLRKASVEFLEVPETFDHQGIVDKIRTVGRAIGAEARGNELAASVDADLKAAEALTRDVAVRKRVLFILSAQGGKFMGAGSDTAADGIIALAGGVNAVADMTGYKALTDEAILSAAPDVVLMMDRAGSHAIATDELFAHPALASTPAGKTKALIRMDGSYLLGFGPRTAGAVRDLAGALYGSVAAN